MRLLVIVMMLMLLATPAHAEVAAASPGAMLLRAEATAAVAPDRAWRGLTRVEHWWNAEHTYSGDAGRLRLTPRAGGCFCERWENGQSVEHARVVSVIARDGVRTLRLDGALGPLQAMAAAGVLTFTVSPEGHGAKISMTYRVSGDPGLALDQLAPVVDQVLVDQLGRLVRYVERGSPE